MTHPDGIHVSQAPKANPTPAKAPAPSPGGKAAGKATAAGSNTPAPSALSKSRVDWKAVWPIPALAGASLLLVGGLVMGILRAPKDDPAAPLADVERLVEEGKFEEAIDVVNQKLVPAVQSGVISKEKQIEMLLLRAGAIAQGQAKLAIDREDNRRSIIKDLSEAESLGHKLSTADFGLKADSLIFLGETAKAYEIAKALPPSDAERKQQLLMRIVEGNLKGGDVRYDMTLEILSGMLDSPRLEPEQRAWAVARQTELRLTVDAADEAISRLLRAMPRLEGTSAAARGELFYLLGRAYFQLAEQKQGDGTLFAQAEKQLESAMELLDPLDPRRTEAQLLIGRVMQATGRVEDAKEAYQHVVNEQQGEGAGATALLGLAECLAALGDDDLATATYDQALDALTAAKAKERAKPKPAPAAAHADASDHGAKSAEHGKPAEHGAKPAEHGAAAPAGHDASGHASAGHETTPTAGHGAVSAKAARSVIKPETIGASLMERQQDRFVRDKFAPALRYATLAERAYRLGGTIPPEVYLALAQSHKRVAQTALAEARTATHDAAPATDHAPKPAAHGAPAADSHGGHSADAGVSSVTASTAKKHFYEAAINFKEHAAAVVVTDNALYNLSLFSSADCYDKAADRASAKTAFTTYLEGASEDDPRRHEARYRLAQVFQAEHDYVAAIEHYRRLAGVKLAVENGKASITPDPNTARAGEWGDRSIVPLARCLLSDTIPENDDLARQLLEEIIAGRRVEPKSDIFRDSITELGEYEHLRGQDYAKAIALLRRAEGYADHPRMTVVKYKLADANRLSAAEIQSELKQNMPQARRTELEVTREERLRVAAAKFQEVIDELGSRHGEHASAAEAAMLRNSMFAVADCAFDLGRDYNGAIAFYEQAAQRYANDPSSLVARTQIVAAYVAMGKWDEARRANELAKRQLKTIPEAALNDPELPMQRRHWQRWFDASSELDKRASAQADANGGRKQP